MIDQISRPKTVLRTALSLSGSIVALCACSGAWAQDTAPQPDATEREIIVTAQFRAQNLQDTPIAITAITSEMLDERGQTTLVEAISQAPSVSLRPQGASFGPSVSATIRGLGQLDFNPAFEPGVGLYVDDVYYSRLTGANFDLMDVERVEILRGPQGTLTGRNSEGGAIKYVTRKPTGDGGGYIEGTYGSRNLIAFRASADFTIAKNLYARLSGTYKEQEGYVKRIDYGCAFPASGIPTGGRAGNDCVVSKHGSIGYEALRGIVRYNPSDAFDLMISADYIHDDRTVPGEILRSATPPPNSLNIMPIPGVPYDSRFLCGRFCNYGAWAQPAATWLGPAAPGFPLVATANNDRSLYEAWSVAGNMVIGLSDSLNLTSITAYREWTTEFNADDDLSPANIGFGQNRLDNWFFSQELRLNGEIGDTLEFTLGGFYSDERTTYFTYQDIRYAPIPLQFIGNDPVNSDSKAVFGTVIWKPFEAATLTGGLRYTDEHKDYTFVRKDPSFTMPNAFLGTLDGFKASFDGDRIDYRLSADYRFAPEILAYATISTGFKGGGVGPRPFNVAQAIDFGPEKVTTYELGVKTDLFDRRVRINAAGFYNDFTDAQLVLQSCPQFGGPGPCALPQNAGDATMMGFEIELSATPVDGLSIDASYSILDWDWDCVVPQVVGLPGTECSSDSAVIDRLSNPPLGVADEKWSFGIQYEIPIGADHSLTPRFDMAYFSAINGSGLASANPLVQVPSYELANARLIYRDKKNDWQASLEVSNLFDKYYFYTTFDLTGAGAGIIKGQPGRPREWSITVKKNF